MTETDQDAAAEVACGGFEPGGLGCAAVCGACYWSLGAHAHAAGGPSGVGQMPPSAATIAALDALTDLANR